jgi:DnaJ-class molecular chaperone
VVPSVAVSAAARGGRVVKGSNLRVRIKLTLEEIALGAEKKIKVTKLVRGKGSEYGTCGTCGGSGQVRACRAPSWAKCKR